MILQLMHWYDEKGKITKKDVPSICKSWIEGIFHTGGKQ